MSEIINQLQGVGSITFEDARNTVAYVGMATLPVVAGIFAADYFRTPKTDAPSVNGADPELLGQVEQEEKSGRFKSRASKWGSWLLIGAGTTIASISMLDPQIEHETTLPGVETLAIIDTSYTMTNTTDMSDGATRLSSVFDAFNVASEAFPADLKAGVVLFGKEAKTTSPLTTDRSLLEGALTSTYLDANGIERPVIDPNGGDIDSAVNLGLDILGGSENIGGETLFVFTDGTLDSSESANQSILDASEKGTNIVIVMPGTPDGSYVRSEYDSNPIESGVDGTFFEELAELENVEIISTSNSGEMQEIIVNRLKEQTTSTEKRPTNLFTIAGLVVAGLGVVKGITKTWKRKV